MKHRWLQTAAKVIGILLVVAFAAVNYSAPVRQVAALPDIVHIAPGERAALPSTSHWIFSGSEAAPAAFSIDESVRDVGTDHISYKLFGVFPVRDVVVVQNDSIQLVPGGDAVGITIRTEGVLVVGLGDVETTAGAVRPASQAGLQAGDWIVSVDGKSVSDSAALSALLSSDDIRTVGILRDSVRMSLIVQPIRSKEGAYRLGAWVRDSTAGIGTLSFLDTASGWFAALGHPVSDIDTEKTLSVREGRLVSAQIVDVIRGSQGAPGELMGVFSAAGAPIGSIESNTDYGIFGAVKSTWTDAESMLPMGYAFDAHVGSAQMLSTISEEGVEAFACEIIRVSSQDAPSTKGMVIEVTDERLLAATGGIVQGMSGSPIVQDGKLVGVVTHVFVNDPTRGYCVYAEWMHQKMLQEKDRIQ